MKSTTLEVNVKTGEQTYKEETLTKAQILELEKQQRASQIQQRLSEIVSELNQSDWRTIKRLEGSLSDEDWNIHLSKRAELRKEHNGLDQELKGLV